MGGSIHLLIMSALVPLALLPSILAFVRHHPQVIPISLVNLVGGPILGIGWIVARVWCFVDPAGKRSSVADEIERLHRLVQAGALTQAEFEAGKKALLHA